MDVEFLECMVGFVGLEFDDEEVVFFEVEKDK